MKKRKTGNLTPVIIRFLFKKKINTNLSKLLDKESFTMFKIKIKEIKKRRYNLLQNKKYKKSNEDLLEMDVVNELDNVNIKSSHTLVELSVVQWKIYKNNSIIVSDLIEDTSRKDNLHIKYRNINM